MPVPPPKEGFERAVGKVACHARGVVRAGVGGAGDDDPAVRLECHRVGGIVGVAAGNVGDHQAAGAEAAVRRAVGIEARDREIHAAGRAADV